MCKDNRFSGFQNFGILELGKWEICMLIDKQKIGFPISQFQNSKICPPPIPISISSSVYCVSVIFFSAAVSV
jgi:hypothetical protein